MTDMLGRFLVVLRGIAMIAILSLGGIGGCLVLSALAPASWLAAHSTANSMAIGVLMGFAFCGGALVAGAALYVVFGERLKL